MAQPKPLYYRSGERGVRERGDSGMKEKNEEKLLEALQRIADNLHLLVTIYFFTLVVMLVAIVFVFLMALGSASVSF